MNVKDLIGTWLNVGYEIVAADGMVSFPFGTKIDHGRLTYHPNGTVAVLAIRTDPKNLGLDKSAAERGAALERVVGYFGHYELKGGVMYHHIETCLNPAWVGTSQERHATLDGDMLVLSPPPDGSGKRTRIIWQRLKGAA